ncbi:hypothetical protein [Marinomonas mediterranea]|uniref:Bile acid:sodium symporter n=1 Tax=Marinomonas mediterranea (strain ATCC 700492 / JCM 21426 / NBRC 103028 / MMB-1) TaxID=717774 RepID=F2K0T8_MARM1|nr:hypothetical protein [Marinomonas mediterranea]ADZ92180.1 hypothetical protein Marme_2959 [Marinomonas mediterranea MMB-1]WCN18242.1 hypothetical protein GV053_14965 [Marinomonas mediterranea MMB-1]
MIAFVVRHSLPFMFVAALLGFALPDASASVFPFLPYVLFSLMLLTLLSMQPSKVLRYLIGTKVWCYSLIHGAGFMALLSFLNVFISMDSDLMLAVMAVAATGSLFATPAIVRALGFDAIEAMAMTIATTLLLPFLIILTVYWYPTSNAELDLVAYGLRLLIFIISPLVLSHLLRRLLSANTLDRILMRTSKYTILLVFAFPFGLIGYFRNLWDQNSILAYQYLLIAFLLSALFFLGAMSVYWRFGKEAALTAAITSGNRNVLLTFTIASGLLGPAFLPLAGAMQLPMYLLPAITKLLHRKL